MTTEEMIHWREYIVAKVLSKEQLRIRWKLINYKPKSIQLKLWE